MAATRPSAPNRRSRPATTPVAARSSKQAAVADRHPAREARMATELRVDSDRRTGHGRCYNAAPNLLSDDEEGFVTLRGSAMPIADGELADAEEAVSARPEHAITPARSK